MRLKYKDNVHAFVQRIAKRVLAVDTSIWLPVCVDHLHVGRVCIELRLRAREVK